MICHFISCPIQSHLGVASEFRIYTNKGNNIHKFDFNSTCGSGMHDKHILESIQIYYDHAGMEFLPRLHMQAFYF